MTQLGIYHTVDGKEYGCNFYPEEGIAIATGPLPVSNKTGFRGDICKVNATTEQEARQNLAKEIGPGHWVWQP